MIFKAIFLSIVLCGAAYGGNTAPTLVVTGAENPVEIGEIITLNVVPATMPVNVSLIHYEWRVIDPNTPNKKTWKNANGTSISFGTGARAGKITVLVDSTYVFVDANKVANDIQSGGIASIDVQVGDPTPPPPAPEPVPPTPQPDPIPPSANILFASYIYDSTKPGTQAIADMRAQLTVGGVLKGLANFRAYDITQPELDNLKLRDTVKAATSIPAVIFQSQTPGQTTAPIVSTIYPTTADQVVAEAKRLKGVK